MSIDEKALQAAIDIHGYAKDDYAKMSNDEVVTSIIAVYEAAKEPVDISSVAKLIHTSIGFDEPWDDLGDTVGINRSREAAKTIARASKRVMFNPIYTKSF